MARSEREVAKGITIQSGKLGGQPCVRGTRITAQMVANLMAGPTAMSAEAIIESYPSLTYADISNVKGWAKGRNHDR